MILFSFQDLEIGATEKNFQLKMAHNNLQINLLEQIKVSIRVIFCELCSQKCNFSREGGAVLRQ